MPETVYVNGQPQPWRPGLSVADLLGSHERVATALNGEFVPQARRAHTLLRPGDQLMVFTAIVAG